MSGKISKPKRQSKTTEGATTRPNRSAQIMFTLFAIILIVSMVLSAVANY
jgi:hypothetical protein